METISKQTRLAFRDHLTGWTLRTIGELFDGADISRRPAPSDRPTSGSVRRALVDEYYAGVSWQSPRDVRKVLRAFEEVLSSLDSATDEWSKKALYRLTGLLRRDGYLFEDG